MYFYIPVNDYSIHLTACFIYPQLHNDGMILDQLIEKKNLLLYLKLRRQQLTEALRNVPKTEKSKRQTAIIKLKSRIKEIANILKVVSSGDAGIRKEGKILWKQIGDSKYPNRLC